jgi:hypothetical protein
VSAKRKPLVVIGWNERIDLPEWGVKRLRAKADTGARTSALHVENVKKLPRDRISFDVLLHRRVTNRRVHVVARISRRARVRSSTGEYSYRYFVRTLMRVGTVEREIEISLVDRSDMIFRMLLGRTALAGSFIVDPSHKNLCDS